MSPTVVAVPHVSPADLDLLARHYEIRDQSDVAAFIRDSPEVVAPLLEAVAMVPRYFGPDTPLALEVVHDPEAQGFAELFAFIRSPHGVDASLAQLRQFEDEWWAEALHTANRKLMFGLEYP